MTIPSGSALSPGDLRDAPFDGEITWESAQIKFTCHGCKGEFEIDAALEGNHTVCPACGVPLIVPGDGQMSKPVAQPEPVPTPKPASTFPPRTTAYHQFKARQRRQRQQWLVLGAIVGAAVLVLLIAVAIRRAGSESTADVHAKRVELKREAPQQPPTELESAFGVYGAFCCIGFFALVILILYIALLAWVARDARCRGIENAVMWVLVSLVFGLIGFAVYWFSRPHGNLVQCKHCGNKRLQASATCPNCGNA